MAASPASSTSRSISTSRRFGSRRPETRSDQCMQRRLRPPLSVLPRGLSAGSLLWPADILAQCLKLLARRAGGIAFDLAVARDQRRAERRQHRAATVLAAGLPFHRGLAADAVDLVDQIPGALVGHVHRAAGGRDRAAGLDILQQLDLARSDASLVRQI